MKQLLFIVILYLVLPVYSHSTELMDDKWQKDIPKKAWELKNEGRTALLAGENDKAVEKLIASVNIAKDYYVGLYNLGLAYFRSDDRENAILWLEKAKDLAKQKNIRDVTIYNTLGFVYMLNGNTENAKKTYEEGIALNIDHAKLFNNYGSLLLQQGSYDLAAKEFKKASELGYEKATENLTKIKNINKAIK